MASAPASCSRRASPAATEERARSPRVVRHLVGSQRRDARLVRPPSLVNTRSYFLRAAASHLARRPVAPAVSLGSLWGSLYTTVYSWCLLCRLARVSPAPHLPNVYRGPEHPIYPCRGGHAPAIITGVGGCGAASQHAWRRARASLLPRMAIVRSSAALRMMATQCACT